MPLAEQIINGSHSIQAYAEGEVTISERVYQGSLVLSATEIISPWPVTSVADLTPRAFDCVVDLKPEVVLLGTGEQQTFPAIEILGHFANLGLGVEVMNTGALCRTFNILVAEDRQVVAAIIQPQD
jgi:uncharacterized protein